MDFRLRLSKLFFIFICSATGTAWAQDSTAPGHFRFWRGFKQDAIAASDFKSNVIEKLVPATAEVGTGKGLVSYMPMFPEKEAAFIPDEIAIIHYSSESAYKALAKTPEFSTYGKMHYETGFFVKTNAAGYTSGSLVAMPLTEQGAISESETSAFTLGNVEDSWQNDKVLVSILIRKDQAPSNSQCVQSLIGNLRHQMSSGWTKGAILLVDPKYTIVYERLGLSNPLATTLPIQEDLSNCFQIRRSALAGGTTLPQGSSGLNLKIQ